MFNFFESISRIVFIHLYVDLYAGLFTDSILHSWMSPTQPDWCRTFWFFSVLILSRWISGCVPNNLFRHGYIVALFRLSPLLLLLASSFITLGDTNSHSLSCQSIVRFIYVLDLLSTEITFTCHMLDSSLCLIAAIKEHSRCTTAL